MDWTYLTLLTIEALAITIPSMIVGYILFSIGETIIKKVWKS